MIFNKVIERISILKIDADLLNVASLVFCLGC